jgi:hypothetical protein
MTPVAAQTAGTGACVTLAASPRSTRLGPRRRLPPAPTATAESWATTATPGGKSAASCRAGAASGRSTSRAPREPSSGRRTRADVARINDHEQIVGIYIETGDDDGSQAIRGFLLERGRFTRIDVPGATSAFPTGIDNSGRIAGRYVDSRGAIHGFLRDRRGNFTDIDVPGAAATAVVDVNDRGQTAGYAPSRSPSTSTIAAGSSASIARSLGR